MLELEHRNPNKAREYRESVVGRLNDVERHLQDLGREYMLKVEDLQKEESRKEKWTLCEVS